MFLKKKVKMKTEVIELLKVVKELVELLISPPEDLPWSFFAELLCDIETLMFCIQSLYNQNFRNVGDTFAKKAVMLLTLKDSELVDAIARSMISEECSRIIESISQLETGCHMYI